MTDHITTSAILARGARAKSLLESEAFGEAMRDLEAYHVASMVSCLPGDAERGARDHHHLMLHALRELATTLAGHVEAAVETEQSLAQREPETEDYL